VLLEHRGKRPSTVPIGWIAVGDQMLPPDRHDDIWAIQRELDFPGTVYGIPRGTECVVRRASRRHGLITAGTDSAG
jgi:hypothetical protein